ncbi:MAG TPA: lipopolysaccharide biosynthesis protein [Gemmatimonadaceae bacterium]
MSALDRLKPVKRAPRSQAGVVERAPENSTLKKRYFHKLSSNAVSIIAGLITYSIVPRALGVNAYGNFSYTNNVITQILNFLDMRTSTGFYVKLSQRQSEKRIITFYGSYTALVFGVLAAIVVILSLPFIRKSFFEGIDTSIIGLALVFVCVKWISDILIKISDAYGTTVSIERIKILNNILGVLMLLALYFTKLVNIHFFYVHQIVIFGLLCLFISRFFNTRNYAVPLIGKLSGEETRSYAKEFYAYSAPLIFYLSATLVTEIFDRYLLQHFGGSFQQGLYGFSFSICAVTLFFVTSMVPLFTRELSIAFSNDDIPRAGRLYRKYVPTMYIVSAYFCCFLLMNADGLISTFGGAQYRASLTPLKILLIHPLISTYSALNGSVVYAKSGTTFIRNLTMVTAPLGMIMTFCFVSTDALNLGATGLALKVLLLEALAAFVMMVYVFTHLRLRLTRYIVHIVLVPSVLIPLAFGIRELLLMVFAAGSLQLFLASGVLYTILVAAVVYLFPRFVGLSREEMGKLLRNARAWRSFPPSESANAI